MILVFMQFGAEIVQLWEMLKKTLLLKISITKIYKNTITNFYIEVHSELLQKNDFVRFSKKPSFGIKKSNKYINE